MVSRQKPSVSIVLGSYNRRPFLEAAIESVRANCVDIPHEIIVIDGGSSDGSLDWLMSQRDIVTIVQHNRGSFRGKPIERKSWGYFMNLGFKAAQADWILMISDDCVLLPGAIAASLETARQAVASGKRVGGVAYFFRNWPADRRYYVQETLGARLMVNHGLFSREAMQVVGFANEDDYVFYKADGDLSLRIWDADYAIIPAPDSLVEHYYDDAEMVRQSNNSVLDHDRGVYAQQWGHLRGKPRRVEIETIDASRTAETVFGAILSRSSAPQEQHPNG
ncbi:hypothetical protein IP69_14850 [Bosea sp. AAP35]|nr:hypothetical protein IP69_14850 [Bosea sp. AAP35]